MFKELKPISIYQWSKKISFLILLIYSTMCTVVIFKMRPQTILVGIDPYGTRVIETTDDRLIRMERHNFVKRFISILYNYSDSTFSQNVSIAGDMMNRELWEKRQSEFVQLLRELKTKPLKQQAEVEDLRELDAHTYQADVNLSIQRNLIQKQVQLRIDIKLMTAPRTGANPYPYEVMTYDEQVL